MVVRHVPDVMTQLLVTMRIDDEMSDEGLSHDIAMQKEVNTFQL
jgi:hypothetical protein